MAGTDGAAVFQTCRKHSKLVAEHFPHIAANPPPTTALTLLHSPLSSLFSFCIQSSCVLVSVSEPTVYLRSLLYPINTQ